MPGHDIVVIGTSAGGVEALTTIVRTLPKDIPTAIFAVLHIPADSPSLLPAILTRNGLLPAVHPSDNERIVSGHIYVAPPDRHLLLSEEGTIRVIRGPKENRHRPAIDPLFRSAALAYGPRVIGVILTGSLDDGTAGLRAIKQRGGITVVQDPQEALYPSMPESAMHHVQIDHCLSLAEIGPLLPQLARQSTDDTTFYPKPLEMQKEVELARMERRALSEEDHTGTPSVFSCPECGGVLWELQDGDLLRFRCRVGHAYSIESMQEAQKEVVEDALWVALKTLEESVSLSRRMLQQAHQRGHEWLARSLEEKMHSAEQRANVLRKALYNGTQEEQSTNVLPDAAERPA